MVLFLILACQQAYQATETATVSSTKYFARHQDPDGSWGTIPERCDCFRSSVETDLDIPVDEDTRRKIRNCIQDFESDDLDTRILAQTRITEFGPMALSELQRGLDNRDSEVRSRCRQLAENLWENDATVRKLSREKARSLARSDVELTGLALLCFMSAGYSHLSRDQYADYLVEPTASLRIGEVVKKGIHWLIARQDEHGIFDPKNPSANAVAALALNEAYGMTASAFLKEPAQRAVDAVAKDRSDDVRFLAWKGILLHSADVNELRIGRADFTKLQELLVGKSGSLACSSVLLLNLASTKKRDNALWENLQASSRDPAPEELLLVSLGVFNWGGPSSPEWKAWGDATKRELLPTLKTGSSGCRKGSWDERTYSGRLRSTALNSLTLMLYYRYSSHFGMSWPQLADGVRTQIQPIPVPRPSSPDPTGAY